MLRGASPVVPIRLTLPLHKLIHEEVLKVFLSFPSRRYDATILPLPSFLQQTHFLTLPQKPTSAMQLEESNLQVIFVQYGESSR